MTSRVDRARHAHTLDGRRAGLGRRGELQRRASRSAGVLCWDEARILHGAKVAQALGLPAGTPNDQRCRDKHRTRRP